MTILFYFKTSLVTFVQRITLKSMFSKKAYKSVARVPCVCSTGCIKKKVIELQRAIVSELLCV